MSNKIPKRPTITYHVNYLESRRKAKAYDKKYEEPKSFPSKPLRPFIDFAAPAGQTFKKDSKTDYFGKGKSAKMKQSEHLLQQYKDKKKSKDHRKKGAQ